VPPRAAELRRIVECHDLGQLSEWVIRAATAQSMAEVFAAPR
jgi:hypothetical protein